MCFTTRNHKNQRRCSSMFSPPASKDLFMRRSSEEQSIHTVSRPERRTFFVNIMHSGWSQINGYTPWCRSNVPTSFATWLLSRYAEQGPGYEPFFLLPAAGITIGSCVAITPIIVASFMV